MALSTDEYEVQLHTVEQALLASTNADERSELNALRENLLELLELTKQTTENEDEIQQHTDDLDDEMKRFMQEIQNTEDELRDKNESDCNEQENNADIKELRANLEKMIGQKCSAPHQHSWGAISYHNAIICGVENTIEVDNDGKLDARLRVLFTNPTHREMLPCTYYLDGECRFDEERCHYSHGELVAFDTLREYSEPDFQRLARNCVVLAKLKDRIWHRGRVLCANFVEKLCRVRLDGKEHKQREQDFPFEDLFPIFHDEDLSSGSSSDSDNESNAEDIDDFEAENRARLVEQSLFTFQPTQPLGEWEKYTKGIGSKLMAKMGYIHGTGLGSDGRGIVVPVSAQILPQGCSLDRCMELREAANGDRDYFSVEKKLRREQKKQEVLNAKAYERAANKVDVFTFLNDSILAGGKVSESKSSINNTRKKNTSTLKEHTTKSLNVESVRIADDIRRKEREIAKVQDSIKRNASSIDVHKRLQAQLAEKKSELHSLQHTEQCLTKEQATRKSKDKLCVF